MSSNITIIEKGVGMCDKCYDVNGVTCVRREAVVIPFLNWILRTAGRDITSQGVFMGQLDETIEDCPVNSDNVDPLVFWPETGGALIVDRKLVAVDGEELREIALQAALRSNINKKF